MKHLNKSILIVFLVMVTASFQSCGSSSSVVMMTKEKFEATNPADIEIYSTKKPDRDYIEIATISTDKYKKFGGIKRSGEKINESLKEKAAGVGAHAIINVSDGLASISGIAIRFK